MTGSCYRGHCIYIMVVVMAMVVLFNQGGGLSHGLGHGHVQSWSLS